MLPPPPKISSYNHCLKGSEALPIVTVRSDKALFMDTLVEKEPFNATEGTAMGADAKETRCTARKVMTYADEGL